MLYEMKDKYTYLAEVIKYLKKINRRQFFYFIKSFQID